MIWRAACARSLMMIEATDRDRIAAETWEVPILKQPGGMELDDGVKARVVAALGSSAPRPRPHAMPFGATASQRGWGPLA